jgi:hypothetical protein
MEEIGEEEVEGLIPFGKPRGHKKLRFSIHFDVDSDEFQQLIQTCHLNLGGQQALPQPHAAQNVIFHPHPGIVNIIESPVQPNIDGWGNLSTNPSSGSNQWLMPPLHHMFILLLQVHQFLYPVHSATCPHSFYT